VWQVRNFPPLPVGDTDAGYIESARRALGELGHDTKYLGHIRLGDSCFVVSAGEDGPHGARPLGCPKRGLVVLHAIVRLSLHTGPTPAWETTEISMLRGRINPDLPSEIFYPREREVGPAVTWVVATLGEHYDLNLCAGLVLDPRVHTVEVEFAGGARFTTKAADGGYFGAVHVPRQPLVAVVRAWDEAGELLQQTRFL